MKVLPPTRFSALRDYAQRVVQPATSMYSTMPAFLGKIPFVRPATPIPGLQFWHKKTKIFKWNLPSLGPLEVIGQAAGVAIIAAVVAAAVPAMLKSSAMDGSFLDAAVQGASAAIVYCIATLMGAASVVPSLFIPGYGVEAANALVPHEATDAQVIVSIVAQVAAIGVAVGALWMYLWPLFAPLVGAKSAIPARDGLSPAQDARARAFGKWTFAGACATAALGIFAAMNAGTGLKAAALVALALFIALALINLFRLVQNLRAAGLGNARAVWVGLNYCYFGLFCGASIAALFVAAFLFIAVVVLGLIVIFVTKKYGHEVAQAGTAVEDINNITPGT